MASVGSALGSIGRIALLGDEKSNLEKVIRWIIDVVPPEKCILLMRRREGQGRCLVVGFDTGGRRVQRVTTVRKS
jgi:hypothetical protein